MPKTETFMLASAVCQSKQVAKHNLDLETVKTPQTTTHTQDQCVTGYTCMCAYGVGVCVCTMYVLGPCGAVMAQEPCGTGP